MINEHEDGRGEIKLLHGYAVVEQELDGDGRLLRWRQLTVTLPMGSGLSMSFSFDFLNQGGDVSIGMDSRLVLGDERDEEADEWE